MRPATPIAPVERLPTFRTPLVEIRDNRCRRHDPALSEETPPLPFHEICFPRTGFWWRHLGKRKLPVDPGSVHLLNRGEVHRVSHPHGCGDANTGILINDPWLRAIARQRHLPGHEQSPFPVRTFPADASLSLQHATLLAATRRRAEPLVVEELAAELAVAVISRAAGSNESATTPAPTDSHRELAQAARALAADRIADRLSLEDVAIHLDVSTFHLCRVFRTVHGCGLGEYRTQIRLRVALMRLAETKDTLELIAAQTGFAHRSHLSRAFARAFGQSPNDYRRRLATQLSRSRRRSQSREPLAFPAVRA